MHCGESSIACAQESCRLNLNATLTCLANHENLPAACHDCAYLPVRSRKRALLAFDSHIGHAAACVDFAVPVR